MKPGCKCSDSDLSSAPRSAARPAPAPFEDRQILFCSGEGALTNQIAKCEDHRIRDGVDVAGALFPAPDQAALKQEIQVLGDIRLVSLKILDQFGNGLFGFGQRLQKAETERLSEIPKTTGDQLQRPVRECDLAHIEQSITLWAYILTNPKAKEIQP